MEGFQELTIWQKVQFYYQGMLENGDKRIENWLLVYSPAPVTFIVMCYLVLVWVGPKLMAKKEPFNLQLVLIVYNFTMVFLSAYMFYEFTAASWMARYSLLCQPVDYSDSLLAMRMARVCWMFYLSKYVEFCDTMFFILRKKNSQLTFLHVYHHSTMILNCWLGLKYTPGGQSFMCGMLNSLVHVAMYLYYGLAAFGPRMTRYLWWKHYLTILQLLQFFLLSIHTVYNLLADCDYPDSLNLIGFIYALTIIALFSHFYYRSYLTSKTNDLRKCKSQPAWVTTMVDNPRSVPSPTSLDPGWKLLTGDKSMELGGGPQAAQKSGSHLSRLLRLPGTLRRLLDSFNGGISSTYLEFPAPREELAPYHNSQDLGRSNRQTCLLYLRNTMSKA
ncbi:elongation of very long chain fatty acids protein 7-like isoform X6 [Phyllopteryx taeniolatus]|nr:elongation of very long chain fatty acids protein 7-like isoform X6 [Phyllopteryx taeniolatus]